MPQAFTQSEQESLLQAGRNPEEVLQQLDRFKKGFPYIKLVRPCIPEDGIKRIGDVEAGQLLEYFTLEGAKHQPLKFVPASGAATRMFKSLHQKEEGLENPAIAQFMDGIEQFAFVEDLRKKLGDEGVDFDEAVRNKDFTTLIDYTLGKGLHLAELPKALIPFHSYGNFSRAAIEEHLVEAATYSCDENGLARIHFTVSAEHQEKIAAHLEQLIPQYEDQYQVRFEISFSVQDPKTDTVAVDLDNQPFSLPGRPWLFRPAGHGALLQNLNELDAELVFIKNIDNVLPDHLKQDTYTYKRILGAYLLKLQEQVFSFLNQLEGGADGEELLPIRNFMRQELGWDIAPDATRSELFELLNRPIRVCGMVKNEGEPGGGPFWVLDGQGRVSAQIVEKAQIDPEDEHQQSILRGATHFNPVDLVCCLKNYKGKLFDLLNYRDMETGFISEKSMQGQPLKAMELPGLWNGGMANWITVFVEVPLSTFSPVKTINDLLKPSHQSA